MKILVINSGSSSIKYQLFDMERANSLATGLIEQIGEETDGYARLVFEGGKIEKTLKIKDHKAALEILTQMLLSSGLVASFDELDAVGHRVVQGGDIFKKPTLLNEELALKIKDLSSLAPLHNKAHYAGIDVIFKQYPKMPQVAVFDTSFHQTMPQVAYMYGLPYELYEKYKIRKYGFHGTSHNYVAKRAAEFLGKEHTDLNAITLHLGNGSSVCAIKNGQSVDTSMGLTPLAGIMMGTRTGDLDPEIVLFLQRQGVSLEKMTALLNKESGLKGICGYNDLRDVLKKSNEGNERAGLALNMFAYQIKKFIGAYIAILGRLDALIFTGGIGENAPITREKITSGLGFLGIELDHDKNMQSTKTLNDISAQNARVKTLVIPTNEELEIATQTMNVVKNIGKWDKAK